MSIHSCGRCLTASLLALSGIAFIACPNLFAARGSRKTQPRTIWYLIVPPFVPGDPPGELQLQAPLARWSEIDSTATAADCEEQRDNMIRMYRSADVTSTTIQFELLLYHSSMCVSANDARLRAGRRHHRPTRTSGHINRSHRDLIDHPGPPVEFIPATFYETRSSPARATQPDLQGPIVMILIGLTLMAAAGSLGGWLHEVGRGYDAGRASAARQPRPGHRMRGIPRMYRRIAMGRYFLICLTTILICPGPAGADPAATVKAHSDAFGKAFNACNVAAVLDLYEDNAALIWPGEGEVANGTPAIAQVIKQECASAAKSTLRLVSSDSYAIGRDYIVNIGMWDATAPGPDGKLMTARVRTTEVLHKSRGKWRYLVDHASIGLPPPVAKK